jgi:hypothetical protein
VRPRWLEWSSVANSIDGNVVSPPISLAMYWSTVVPSLRLVPLAGKVPLSHIAELTEWPFSP